MMMMRMVYLYPSNIGKLQVVPLFLLLLIVTSTPVTSGSIHVAFGAYAKAPQSPTGPTLEDKELTVEKVTDGLEKPTSMAFLGPNDILVTEKETGKVIHVINGQIQDDPALDVAVANSIERGLLGIAIAKQPDGKTFVFLSYTESGNDEDGS